MDNIESRPVCCNKPMIKHGTVWSGRNKRQQYLCTGCGRTTIVMPQIKTQERDS